MTEPNSNIQPASSESDSDSATATIAISSNEHKTFHVECSDLDDGDIVFLPPDALDNTRYQPRAIISAGDELKQDIERNNGNIYPVLVQKSRMAIIDGHRRYDAIKQLWQEGKNFVIKCEIRDISDEDAAILAFQANVLSNPLSEGERDRWIYRLLSEYGLSVTEVCKKTGLAESTIRNIQRAFSKTTETVREALETGKLSTGIAKAIATLPPRDQTRIAKKAIQQRLTVRDAELEAAKIKARTRMREQLIEYLQNTYGENKKILLEGTRTHLDWKESVIRTVFGSPWHSEGNYTVSVNDVTHALNKLGLTLETPRPDLCKLCLFYNLATSKCEQNTTKDEEGDCEFYLPRSNYLSSYYGGPIRCAYCNGFTISHFLPDSEEWNSLLDITSEGHAFCVFQNAISEGYISGKCETCGLPPMCDVVHFTRIGNRRIHVKECKNWISPPALTIERLNEQVNTRIAEELVRVHSYSPSNSSKSFHSDESNPNPFRRREADA